MPFSRSVISVTESSVEDKFIIFGSMVCKGSGCVGNAGGCGISSVVSVVDGSGRKVEVKNSFVVGCCIVVVVLFVLLRVIFDFQKELDGQLPRTSY